MKRRDFLAATSSFLVPVMVGGMGVKAFGANSPLVQSLMKTDALAKDRVLVIIYLNGGNDGLNTVIPLDQYSQYNTLRSNIAIPQASVLPIGNGLTGLHPSMTGLKQLHDNGKVAVVHSVSYPTPNYSHYRATDIWMTGSDSNVQTDTGWAGRYLEDRFLNYPTPPITDRDAANATMEDPLAIQIGYLTSTTVLGSNQSMAVAINDPASYATLVGGGGSGGTSPDLPCCEAGELVSFIRQQQALAVGYSAEITAAHNAGNITPAPVYPTSNSIADQLKIVARLVGGGLKTKIYFLSIGGFDTHSGQVQSGGGTNNNLGGHATLLGRVSAGITAFQADLQQRGVEDKVVGFTFSEFGRRANSNSSAGTDHGVAAPMFVFGSSLKRQMVGRNPNIGGYSNLPTDLNGTTGNQDLKMQIDFRRIYWDILIDWFGRSKTDATSVLLNKSFDTVSLFTDEVCTIKTGSWHDEKTWSCGRVPFTTENARICAGHTVTLSANATVKNLQNYGNLNIATGVKLSVAGI